MNIRVFKKKEDKIEFTTKELAELLNEVYNDGYHDGENHIKYNYFTWAPTLTPVLNNSTVLASPGSGIGLGSATSTIIDSKNDIFHNLKELTDDL